jgi:hypothetical protein
MPVRMGVLAGTVGPGVLLRQVSGANATRDWQPTLMLAMAGGAHRVSANFGHLQQNPGASGASDVATTNFALDYRYRYGIHEFGIDWTAFDRIASPGTSTAAHRVGITWTMLLDGSRAPVRTASGNTLAAAPLTAAGAVRSAELLSRLAPGMDLQPAVDALAQGGFGAGVREPGLVVYETRLLAEVEQRQRLALAHDAGRLERSVLVVSLADSGGGDEAGRIFERVRRALLDRFGNPSFAFEEGRFGASFAQDVATGKLVRVMEWRTEAGVLRLGIPRRLDGTARIEVHHARSFPSPRDTAWGLEALR